MAMLRGEARGIRSRGYDLVRQGHGDVYDADHRRVVCKM
jgi:hypothetical protein